MRCSDEQRAEIDRRARAAGFADASKWVLATLLSDAASPDGRVFRLSDPREPTVNQQEKTMTIDTYTDLILGSTWNAAKILADAAKCGQTPEQWLVEAEAEVVAQGGPSADELAAVRPEYLDHLLQSRAQYLGDVAAAFDDLARVSSDALADFCSGVIPRDIDPDSGRILEGLTYRPGPHPGVSDDSPEVLVDSCCGPLVVGYDDYKGGRGMAVPYEAPKA